MNIIAMIPARLGSKRIPKKNLRFINNKPLINYVLDTIKKVNCFDEIYINSESNVFHKIANSYGINFYKRKKKFATDKSTSDEFCMDFINNVKGDILIQILPTSPLITSEEITNFVKTMIKKKYDTFISVENIQIECIYKNKPINFKKIKKSNSQDLIPIKAYSTALMGWKCDTYKKNMKKYGSAYHGYYGKTGYFELKGLSTIDIDNEDDFNLAERIINSKPVKKNKIKYYY